MHKIFFEKYYFIEKIYKSNLDKQCKNTTIIYRNYEKNYDLDEILYLRNYCKKRNLRFLVSNNIGLSIKLDLEGAYIPSFNNSYRHLSYNFKQKFEIIGSAHNLKEIKIKERQGVSKIFISSIFKENSNFLGLNKFKIVSNYSKKKIIALGGVSKKNLELIKLTKSIGFAGISYFQGIKKGP